jgi:hypothetical protein
MLRPVFSTTKSPHRKYWACIRALPNLGITNNLEPSSLFFVARYEGVADVIKVLGDVRGAAFHVLARDGSLVVDSWLDDVVIEDVFRPIVDPCQDPVDVVVVDRMKQELFFRDVCVAEMFDVLKIVLAPGRRCRAWAPIASCSDVPSGTRKMLMWSL